MLARHIKPRLPAHAADPKVIDLESGVLIGAALDAHLARTGETIPTVSANIGIGKESLRAYQRGHQVPTDASREKLETYLGMEPGALKPKPKHKVNASKAVTTHMIEGNVLVITTRMPLAEVA